MDVIDALLMGLLQGLTEYLPVSSSGHLAIASHFFGIEGEANLTFTVAVHVATVFSTLVILWKDIVWIFKGLFDFKGPGMNESQRYALNILVSMIPDLFAADGFAADVFILCPPTSERKHISS